MSGVARWAEVGALVNAFAARIDEATLFKCQRQVGPDPFAASRVNDSLSPFFASFATQRSNELADVGVGRGLGPAAFDPRTQQ